ncbi:MAG: FtsX-like permease family protein [Lewinellaceae bacterium]|nr:FtsX-like permease family protein [Lewinellaceae bacterium]
MSRIMGAGTLLAICIACLGLFGIATFTVSRRTKEIGIRKVMGAGVGGVVGMLSRDFMLLVGIAFVLATPVAWWAMHNWLGNFAYHVPLDWWVFPVAGALAAAVAFLTVGVQCVKAALANPVESLRSE